MVCHSVYMDFYETVTAYKPGAKIPPWPWHKYPAKWGWFFLLSRAIWFSRRCVKHPTVFSNYLPLEKRTGPLFETMIALPQRMRCFVPSLDEIGSVVLEKSFKPSNPIFTLS